MDYYLQKELSDNEVVYLFYWKIIDFRSIIFK
jgi:hypothetical protein